MSISLIDERYSQDPHNEAEQVFEFEFAASVGDLIVVSSREAIAPEDPSPPVLPGIACAGSEAFTRIAVVRSGSGAVAKGAARVVSGGMLSVAVSCTSNMRADVRLYRSTLGGFAALVEDSGLAAEQGSSNPAVSPTLSASNGQLLTSVVGSSSSMTVSSAGAGWDEGPVAFERVCVADRIADADDDFAASWSHSGGSDMAVIIAAFTEEGEAPSDVPFRNYYDTSAS